MAYQQVASLNADVAVSLGKTDKKTGKAYPTQVEGYYLGARQQDTKLGVSTAHFLQTSTGNLLVWGTTDLNRKIAGVKPGTMVRVTATGTTPTPKGPMRTFKVEQDLENTIEVAGLDEGRATYADEEEENDNVGNTTDEDDNTENERVSAISRKAQVDAILKARKSK